MRRRCAVLGSPVAHSLSPALHRAAYAEIGLDWSYEARDVREDDLATFLDGLDESWRGLSLTMPLKRAVLPLLDGLSPRAQVAQVVNTVIFDEGRRRGHNTDIVGAVAAIAERHRAPLRSAVILGGGATAVSALLGLVELDCQEVSILVRSTTRAEAVVEAAARLSNPPALRVLDLSTDPVEADILVSTIPAAAQTSSVVTLAAGVPVIFDVVYDPWPTPLAAMAESGGHTLVSGLDLLVHQAAEQFTLMTGVAESPVQVMRAAGERVLTLRGSSAR